MNRIRPLGKVKGYAGDWHPPIASLKTWPASKSAGAGSARFAIVQGRRKRHEQRETDNGPEIR